MVEITVTERQQQQHIHNLLIVRVKGVYGGKLTESFPQNDFETNELNETGRSTNIHTYL
jgi:hypothetical protein